MENKKVLIMGGLAIFIIVLLGFIAYSISMMNKADIPTPSDSMQEKVTPSIQNEEMMMQETTMDPNQELNEAAKSYGQPKDEIDSIMNQFKAGADVEAKASVEEQAEVAEAQTVTADSYSDLYDESQF